MQGEKDVEEGEEEGENKEEEGKEKRKKRWRKRRKERKERIRKRRDKKRRRRKMRSWGILEVKFTISSKSPSMKLLVVESRSDFLPSKSTTILILRSMCPMKYVICWGLKMKNGWMILRKEIFNSLLTESHECQIIFRTSKYPKLKNQ